MATRRDFLQGAFATTSLALGGTTLAGIAFPAAARTAGATGLRLDTAFYQPDLAPSAMFASELRRRGVTVHAFDGDISPLWTDGVFDAWRERPAVVAGLTTYPALFLLERVGWDCGMRVVFRGEHATDQSGQTRHALEGPEAMLRIFQADPSARLDLGACLARAASRVPTLPAPASTCSLASTEPVSVGGERLYSWVIAPRAPATT